MSNVALKIGDVIQDGSNKGWIYCETLTKEPFLVAPQDSGVMMWRDAMEFAERHGSKLPTLTQLNAMYNHLNTGGLKDTFNRTGSDTDGRYWSSTQGGGLTARCQKFSDGNQLDDFKLFGSYVRCVRPFSIA